MKRNRFLRAGMAAGVTVSVAVLSVICSSSMREKTAFAYRWETEGLEDADWIWDVENMPGWGNRPGSHDTEDETETETETEGEIETRDDTETENLKNPKPVMGETLHPGGNHGEKTGAEIETGKDEENGSEIEAGLNPDQWFPEKDAQNDDHPTGGGTGGGAIGSAGGSGANNFGTDSGTDLEDWREELFEDDPLEKENPLSVIHARRGVDYEIEGSNGCYYRDSSGKLWVKKGSNLDIHLLSKEYYVDGVGKSAVSADGNLRFSLEKVDADGHLLARSETIEEAYYLDAEAPSGALKISGTLEGELFYANERKGILEIPEDTGSGIKTIQYSVISVPTSYQEINTETLFWKTCRSGQEISFGKDGVYQVFSKVEDMVGNIQISRSKKVVIDQTPPVLKINGVKDESANSKEVKISISVNDKNYKEGSLMTQINGMNTGNSMVVKQQKSDSNGAMTEYFDVPWEKKYDDIYELFVKAEDLSGNRVEKKIHFSVNRFGSVYSLDDKTAHGIEAYYLQKPIDIVFYETNIDYISTAQIYCRRNGELLELLENHDYKVQMEGEAEKWKRYKYTVPSSVFKQEGTYELLLTTKDAANNASDTSLQRIKVIYVLDWSAPKCSVTGIEQEGVYQEESVTICVIPSDNVALKQARVYQNSALVAARTEFGENDNSIRLELPEDEKWQRIQVFLEDKSGNKFWSEEIPVFINHQIEQAPQYVKTEESAQELAERKIEIKSELISKKEETKKTVTDSRTEENAAPGTLKKTILPKEKSKGKRAFFFLFTAGASFGAVFVILKRRIG